MTQLAEWQKRFYPVTAVKLAQENPDPIALTAHALRKWVGLKPQHLEQYGLTLTPADETTSVHVAEAGNNVQFTIDGYTCSLCQVYSIPVPSSERCQKCPLYETQRNSTCGGMLATTPYGVFLRDKDPEPMISALRATLHRLSGGMAQVDNEGNYWIRDFATGVDPFSKTVNAIKDQHDDIAHKLADLHEKMSKEAALIHAQKEDYNTFITNVENLEKTELQNIIFNIAHAMYDVSEDNADVRFDFDHEVSGSDIVDVVNNQFVNYGLMTP